MRNNGSSTEGHKWTRKGSGTIVREGFSDYEQDATQEGEDL